MAIGDGGGPAPANFGMLLAQKYAQMQQQQDSTSQNAATAAITGAAQANSLNAEAGLTGVRARVLPGETAAEIALKNAQGGLFNQQAKVVVPTATSAIAQNNAQTAGILDTNGFNRHTRQAGYQIDPVSGAVSTIPGFNPASPLGSLGSTYKPPSLNLDADAPPAYQRAGVNVYRGS
jgi:hypothetical protein